MRVSTDLWLCVARRSGGGKGSACWVVMGVPGVVSVEAAWPSKLQCSAVKFGQRVGGLRNLRNLRGVELNRMTDLSFLLRPEFFEMLVSSFLQETTVSCVTCLSLYPDSTPSASETVS